MAKNKTLINIHAKRYVKEVFEQRIRDEGFSCPDDKLLCWYRVRNGEVLDTVVFCTDWSAFPLSMDIYYETIPLFTEPFYIQSAKYNSSIFGRMDCYKRDPIIEGEEINSQCYTVFRDDILVFAPSRGQRGLYTLTHRVLPYLAKMETARDCYEVHKERHAGAGNFSENKKGCLMSREFIDEAVFFNDTAIYPCCKDQIVMMLGMIDRAIQDRPRDEKLKEIFMHWQQLEKALFKNGRDEYLENLHQRTEKNKALLKKKLGLVF